MQFLQSAHISSMSRGLMMSNPLLVTALVGDMGLRLHIDGGFRKVAS